MIAGLLILLCGCEATGSIFDKNQRPSDVSKAMVYIYRPSIAINCCVSPHIIINGEKRGSLKNGGFLYYEVTPGTISVEAVNEAVGFKSLKLTFEVKNGESYYLRWAAAATWGLNPGRNKKGEPNEMKSDKVIFASDEAKTRMKEQNDIGSGADETRRAVDRDIPISTEGAIFAVEHEREFRLMKADVALMEISRTKLSN